MSTSFVSLNAALPPVAGAAAQTSSSSTASSSAADTSALANQNVFLQLLVAQLKNQDPDNPASGTEFVTQLAQFTTLEQQTQSRTDLDSILKIMGTPPTTAAPAAPAASAKSTTTQS